MRAVSDIAFAFVGRVLQRVDRHDRIG